MAVPVHQQQLLDFRAVEDPLRLIKRLARFTYVTDMLRDFGETSNKCMTWGMPLLAMYPAVPANAPIFE